MARDFPHTGGEVPSFNTRHEAEGFIADYQDHGHIKRCAHLYTREMGGGYSGRPRTYGPGCRQDSFRRERHPINYMAYGNWLFYGCPQDCRLYEPAWKEGIEVVAAKTGRQAGRAGKALAGTVAGIAKWYASLNGIVQIIIAVIILSMFGTPFVLAIAELVKAFR